MKRQHKMASVCMKLLSVLLLLAVIAVTCFPFVIMVTGGFKEDYEIFTLTPKLLPQNGFKLTMYQRLMDNWPFMRSMWNSVFVSVTTTALACFFCSAAGVAFAKYSFPGKNLFFLLMLSSMMFPSETRLIPTYSLFRAMGGVNQMWSLILPGMIPAFGIFMMRQFSVSSISNETLEAARIEGASENHILLRICMPMLRPAIASLAILTFMGCWNDFLWPIIIMTKKENLTVTALLRSIGDVSMNGGYGVLLAATTLSLLPLLVVYFCFNKQLVNSVMEGSGKE